MQAGPGFPFFCSEVTKITVKPRTRTFPPLPRWPTETHNLTYDVVSAVGAGVVLQQPGVHALLMKPVSTGDDPQLLEDTIPNVTTPSGDGRSHDPFTPLSLPFK